MDGIHHAVDLMMLFSLRLVMSISSGMEKKKVASWSNIPNIIVRFPTAIHGLNAILL